MSKYVDMIGWDDAPHLSPPHISKEELDELEASMLPHQRTARRTGRPSLGAGAIYPVDEDSIFVDPFAIPDYFWRGYGFDVGWRMTAAALGAYDPDTDITYITAEYYRGEAEPLTHAHAIRSMMAWDYTGAIDPASRGRNQKDGTRLMAEYEDLGLELVKANNAVEAGIHHVLLEMQAGRLKVFRTCQYWRREFRLYRRDEKGKIVKENDHLMDSTRYLLFTDGVFSSEPIQRAARGRRGGEW